MALETGAGVALGPDNYMKRVKELFKERDASIPGSPEELAICEKIVEAMFDVNH